MKIDTRGKDRYSEIDIVAVTNNIDCEGLAKKNSISNCICDRPERTVKCLTCGATFRGHAALVCNEHPRRINLMDVRLCPNTSCRSAYLMEFEEG
ncbi:unnamed protein product [Brugia timori]|uniref:C2H2-type domain-containing protein n=2 Tax=Onchocercidae TaxID=6296 RepID=A0A0R3QK56_9BILA|nr:unnamed protein product [Brugia timori]